MIKLNGLKVTAISVTGKRWFSPTFGNTYHTCAVSITTEGSEAFKLVTEVTDPTYGYDAQYETTAAAAFMQTEGVELTQGAFDVYYFRKLCEDLGITYTTEVTNVKRKKDL